MLPALREKAASGKPEDLFNLAEALERDNATVKEALSLYEQAAQAGHTQAARYAAYILRTGPGGIPKHPVEAVEYYKRAASDGDARSMACLGYMYEVGEGVKKDGSIAADWYTKAAERGDATAMCNLALCLEKGIGREKNPEQARHWFEKAAEEGNINGMINAGLYHEKGEGGASKDMFKAFGYYSKAAAKGDPTAAAIVGCCYEKGLGVAVNNDAAADFYTRAAMAGNPHAKEGLRRMMNDGKI